MAAPTHAEHVTPRLIADVIARNLREHPDRPVAIFPASDPVWAEMTRDGAGTRETWLEAVAILRRKGRAEIVADCLPEHHPTPDDPAVTVFIFATDQED